jgi:hypothetical protein
LNSNGRPDFYAGIGRAPNVDALAGAMRTFSESEDLLECVPKASIEISKRLLPSSFAETVIPFILEAWHPV